MNQAIDPSVRRFLKALATGAAALAAGCATRQVAVPEEGFEYRTVEPPQRTATPGKLEVLEFFWYACPFCNAMEPILREWLQRQPADVAFRRIHVPRPPLQQFHYTLEVLGKADELSERIYAAIHLQQLDLETRDRMADFVARNGVDRARFIEAFGSPAVRAKMQEATATMNAYKVDGVPTFAVNGKWITAPSMLGGSYTTTLRVFDYLLARERRGAA